MSKIKISDNTSVSNSTFNDFDTNNTNVKVIKSNTQRGVKNKYSFNYSSDHNEKYVNFNILKNSESYENLEKPAIATIETYKNELIQRINDASSQEEKLKKLMNDTKAIFDEIDNRKDDFTNETKLSFENIRNSIFTTIAMFAAFFAFISVSFNAFSKVNSTFETISLIIVMWSCIVGFLGIFFIYVYNVSDKKVSKTNVVIVILSIGVSIFITFLSVNNEERIINYEKLKADAKKEIIEEHNKNIKKINSELTKELKSN
ncbi:hypothetical protein [Acinetobacter soli]|uniref:hypothetical protein n=1 Tax=Acinetobacter soli TaxID=487316 RepID=UPI0032B58C9E